MQANAFRDYIVTKCDGIAAKLDYLFLRELCA
jgi:hypothetical protein